MTSLSSHAVVPLAIVAGAMVLTAAACGGNAGESPSPSGAGEATVTVTATSASVPQGPAPTPPSVPPGTPVPVTCTVQDLRVRYADDKGSAGAGSVAGTFTFTNTGSTACGLRGFPGVSYVGAGDGTQVGQPATRTDDAVRTRLLAAGKSVTASLRRSQPGSYGDSCRQTEVDGFRVYPPDSTESAFVAFRTTGCKSNSAPLLQVGPVE